MRIAFNRVDVLWKRGGVMDGSPVASMNRRYSKGNITQQIAIVTIHGQAPDSRLD
jgi:hypothetical protein